jgi:hypothetical protein
MTKTKPMTKFVWLKQTTKDGVTTFFIIDVPPSTKPKDVLSYFSKRRKGEVSLARKAPMDAIKKQLLHTRAFKMFLNDRIAFLMESKKHARK